MANRDTPYGLKPAFHLAGGIIRLAEYHIADALTNDIFYGDVVNRVQAFSGREARDIDAADTPASEVPFVGVFAGCKFTNASGEMIYSRYWPTGTSTLGTIGATAYVWDDPFIVFQVQGDSSADGLDTDLGELGDLVQTAEGSKLTGLSGMEVVMNPDGNQNVFFYGLVAREDNVLTTSNPDFLVLLNEHAYRNGGIGSYATEDTS